MSKIENKGYKLGRNPAGRLSYSNGDAVAVALSKMDLENQLKLCSMVTDIPMNVLVTKYIDSGMSPAGRRLGIGHMIRGELRRRTTKGIGENSRTEEQSRMAVEGWFNSLVSDIVASIDEYKRFSI